MQSWYCEIFQTLDGFLQSKLLLSYKATSEVHAVTHLFTDKNYSLAEIIHREICTEYARILPSIFLKFLCDFVNSQLAESLPLLSSSWTFIWSAILEKSNPFPNNSYTHYFLSIYIGSTIVSDLSTLFHLFRYRAS